MPKVENIYENELEGLTEEQKEILRGECISPRELAQMLHFSRVWATMMCQQGRVRAVKLAGDWRIPKDEALRLLRDGIEPLPKAPKLVPVQRLILTEEQKQVLIPRKSSFLSRLGIIKE